MDLRYAETQALALEWVCLQQRSSALWHSQRPLVVRTAMSEHCLLNLLSFAFLAKRERDKIPLEKEREPERERENWADSAGVNVRGLMLYLACDQTTHCRC